MTDTTDQQGEGKGFLGRWSERKANSHQLTEQAESADPASSQQDLPAVQDDAGKEEEAPVLCDEDMPAIESIKGDSDVAGFMSPGVTEGLRKQALRRLFHAAEFNVCDGLDDYDEDFTKFEKLGDIVTADMRHRIEMEEEKQRQLALAESEQVAEELETGASEQDQLTVESSVDTEQPSKLETDQNNEHEKVADNQLEVASVELDDNPSDEETVV